MEIVKLRPAVKTPVWSGEKISKWNKKGCAGRIGETWELSFLKEGLSLADGGVFDGKPLADIADKSSWGTACKGEFPLLIKFIDAAADLSVQVHPNDAYAAAHGLASGKTEMWYVVDADEGAGLYLGFNRDVNPSEVRAMAEDGSIVSALNFMSVKRGDCFTVRAGTVHAIGAGVTVAEVQQSSDVTFRVYDYGRVGADGKPRSLHLDSAIEVMDFGKYKETPFPNGKGLLSYDCKRISVVSACEYFSVYEACGTGSFSCRESFLAFICVEGYGFLEGREFKKGDTFFVPAGQSAKVSGECRYLIAGADI